MCGIFAYIRHDNDPITDEEVKEYFNRVQHRGPDSSYFLKFKQSPYTVFLGFHRLAIIDNTEKSNTILNDDDVFLVCNGEIYNYKHLIDKYQLPVKTGSDCEVILQYYIKYPHNFDFPSFLQELDGVFAFVLYDKKRNYFIMSRDRFGVRPMFWGSSAHLKIVEEEISRGVSTCFASEGKAIPLTMQNNKQFPPGHYIHGPQVHVLEGASPSLGVHNFSLVNGWLNVGKDNYINVSYDRAMQISKMLFIDAVEKRLMSERPIGFLLSGGLDSSLVASVAAQYFRHFNSEYKIQTFSIGLPNSKDLLAARVVAKFLNSDHHEVVISTRDIIDAMPDVVKTCETYDITTIRASIPMYLIAKYIRTHTDIKVIFSGEGADELLGGYLYFYNAPTAKDFQKETHSLLANLHKYDLLRGDRTTARWGLELRVPFLDAALTSFVKNIDPLHKMPSSQRIEKTLFRQAFTGFLPEEILQRKKEAFSDGVSSEHGENSIQALKEFANNSSVVVLDYPPPIKYARRFAQPHTKEAALYHSIFCQHYGNFKELYPEHYWMPQWSNESTDPSATVLEVYKK